MLNPTSADYTFEWTCEDTRDLGVFSCSRRVAELPSGRRLDITFEFEPRQTGPGVLESFWRFSIAAYGLHVPFLLVGRASEPRVLFDKSHVTFQPLLVGKRAYEFVHLVNHESMPITYRFDQASCYAESRSSVVLVEPAHGVLAPSSRTPVQLAYQPTEQRLDLFNVKCMLGGSTKPLTLHVRGEGFAISTALFCEDTATNNRIQFTSHALNEIHMGEVEKNETCYRTLHVVNSGKYAFAYDWKLFGESPEALSCFTVNQERGYVEPGATQLTTLKYVAKLERSTVATLKLEIENGPAYHVHLDGIAVRPDVYFSFGAYDFGACFVHSNKTAGMKAQSVELALCNRSAKDLSIVCLNDLSESCFQLDFKQAIIAPGKMIQTWLTFMPRESRRYDQVLVFELNGLTKREVRVSGVGTPMLLELSDAKQRLVDLGTLEPGKQSKTRVQLVNKSLAHMDLTLLFEPKSEHLARDKTHVSFNYYEINIIPSLDK